MAVFELTEKLFFPDPRLADPDGLLAIGGDLSVERLLLAYSKGIFPWFEEDTPILWWSPDPRMVIFPERFRVSHSLRNTLRKGMYQVTFDRAFPEVIHHCAHVKRKDGKGTWIVPAMREAYLRLHEEGYAHSVESWFNGQLAGGLYGVSLGRIFFGESMFYLRKDASKVALYALVQKLREWQFFLIDAQQDTPHIRSLGGELISIEKFLNILHEALNYPTRRGKWTEQIITP